MKLKLQARYALSISLLTITIVVTLAAFLLYQFDAAHKRMAESNIAMTEEGLISQMEKKGETVVTLLAENLVDPFYYYDLEEIDRLLSTTLAQKDVLSVYLYDDKGTIIHEGDDDVISFELKLGDIKSLEIVQEKSSSHLQMQGEMLAAYSSIWIGDTALGGIKVVLSMESVRESIARLKERHALITQEVFARNLQTLIVATCFLILLAISIAVIMARRLIMPIRQLSDYSRQIGLQNYQFEEPEGRDDEIGDLISSLKKMSTDLQKTTISKDHYMGIVKNMNEMLLLLAPDETIFATNPAAKEITGCRPEDLVGKPARSLFSAKSQGKWNAWIKKIQNADSSVRETLQLETEKDPERIVSVSGSVMTDSSNLLKNYVCVVRDITEQEKIQNKLRIEKEKAIKASLAKSEFMARMSHEIRTPMNGILGMNQLLLGTELNDRQRHFANRIEQSGQLLLEVVNDVLDLSKIEAGKMSITVSPFNLNDILEKVVDLLGENTYSKGLEVGYYYSSDVPERIVGDSAKIQQILFNLVGNAIKFTEHGEVLLRVTSTSRGDNIPFVRFEVIDSGIGISDKDRLKVFEKFIQADGSLTREFGGTGLGLSITKQLVDMMKGEIGFDSEAGKGSTFWFEIPLEKAGDDSPRADIEANPDSLLVVHKNEKIRGLLCEQVTSWGFNCVAVADISTALIKTHNSVGMVLIELDIGSKPELDAAAKLIESPAFQKTTFVALVGMNQVVKTGELKKAGFKFAMQKPLKTSSLLSLFKGDAEALTDEPEQEIQTISESSEPARETAPRILLVEDNPVNLEVTLAMLESLGLDADLAKNGQEAVDAFAQGEYSLILMDIQMPVMDGFEATRLIRELEADLPPDAERIPIIAQTAYLLDEGLKNPEKCGMDDKLGKPFNLRQLSKILDCWLPKTSERIREASVPAQIALGDKKEKPSASALDPDAFREVCSLYENNSNITLDGMIKLFLSDADKVISKMSKAIDENDCKTVRSLTHQLRSSSALIGALTLSGLTSQINTVAREDKLGKVQPLFRKFEKEYSKVKQELAEEIDKMN